MIAQVRDLVASDSAALPALVSLFSCATSDQLWAIGSGLAQAARICAIRDQQFATEIQRTIVATESDELNMAYSTVLQDVSIGQVDHTNMGEPSDPSDPGDPASAS